MTGAPQLIPATIASAFTVGMILALVGSIKLPLARRLEIDEGRVGGLLAGLSVSLIPMMLLSGVLIDRWGVQPVLIGGTLLSATGIACLAMARSYKAAVGALLVIGAAAPCISSGSVVLMSPAFWPEYQTASMNLGNVFFGLGALLTPALAEYLMRKLSFRRALGILALFCLVPAFLAAATPRGTFPRIENPGTLASVLSDPLLWLCSLVFFLYMPVELATGAWATTYLTDRGLNERRASLLLSGFWLTFLLSRLAVAFLHAHVSVFQGTEPWLVLGLGLGAGVVLGNMVGASSRREAGWCVLLLGVCLGPIFPTLTGIAVGRHPSEAGTAYGAFFALGATGSLIIPPLIGAYARKTNIQRALRIPMVLGLLLAAASMVLGLSLGAR